MSTKFATKSRFEVIYGSEYNQPILHNFSLYVFLKIEVFSNILAQIHYLYVDRFRTKHEILVLGKRNVHKKLIWKILNINPYFGKQLPQI